MRENSDFEFLLLSLSLSLSLLIEGDLAVAFVTDSVGLAFFN